MTARPLCVINGQVRELPDGVGVDMSFESGADSRMLYVVASGVMPTVNVDASNGTLAAKSKTLPGDKLWGVFVRGYGASAAHAAYTASILVRAIEAGDVGGGTYTDFSNATPGTVVNAVVLRTATQLTSVRAPLATKQAAPAVASATGTLTAAALLGGIINSLPSSAISLTLPTGALLEAAASWPSTDLAFEWCVRNGGTAAVTLVAGAGHSLDVVGSSASVAAGTIANLRTRYSASGTFITYRL